MLTEREETMLETVIRDYITSATPVSSKRILEIEKLPLSSATIRNTLAVLEENGYLTHPHTSAGRIPTQKGYRFFVDNLMDESTVAAHIAVQLKQVKELNELVHMIANETHLFTIASTFDGETYSNFGMRELLQEPEFQDLQYTRQFGSFIDTVIDNIAKYESLLEPDDIHVFIEKENPMPEGKQVSVIASRFKGGDGCILTIGPTRMDYESAAALLKNAQILLRNIFEE